MKNELFLIRDVVADTFFPIYQFRTKGLFLRYVLEQAADSKSVLARFPSEYILYHAGTIDTVLGNLKTLGAPVSLGAVSEFIDTKSDSHVKEEMDSDPRSFEAKFVNGETTQIIRG